MSSLPEDTNITIGRQAWSSSGRLLGAGTSSSSTASEVGLSEQPAAMRQGLRTEQRPDEAKVHPRPAIAALSARQMQERHLPEQPVQSSSQLKQQQQTAGQQNQQQQQHVQRGAPSTTSQADKTGQPQLVSPAATQHPWYSTAWQHVKALVVGTPPDPLTLGPPWTKWPDFARCNNINAVLMGLWPSVSEAVEQQLVMQMAPQLMEDAAKTYGAGLITGLKLMAFELGEVPPRLDGIKVYEEVGDEQVLMELAVSWGSNIKATVGVTLQVLGHAFTIPVTVQKLQVHTQLRVSAQPLMDTMPYVGAVGVSLMEPPHLDFELPVGVLAGIDIMALPLIRGAFRLGVRLAARQFAVYPKGISVPLIPGGAAAGGPSGMLEVHLMRISGLRSEDLVGHSDPYVILRLREGRQLRSRTIDNNNNPEYDETFRLLVDDPDTQVLQLIVMDEDLIGGGKVMGVAQMPLKQSACVAVPKTKVQATLTINKLMVPQQGIGGLLELPIRMAGLPITAAATGGRLLYQNLAGALGVGGGSERGSGPSFDGSQYSKPLDETGWLGPSEEFLEEQGKVQWKPGHKQQQHLPRTAAAAANPSAAAAAPAGPESPHGHPSGLQLQQGACDKADVSPSSSVSSFHTAASSSVGSSPSSSPASSTTAFAPAALSTTTTTCQIISSNIGPAATAATTASVLRERRTSASEASTSGSSLSPDSPSTLVRPGQAGPEAAAVRTGMRRLGSSSAPLLHVYAPSQGSEISEMDAALILGGQQREDHADNARSSSSSSERNSVSRNSSSSSISQGSVSAAAGTAPPKEVLHHQRKVEEKEEQQGSDTLRDMQMSAGAGATQKALTGDQLKPFYRGTIFLGLTYTPFTRPDSSGTTGAGASPAGTAERMAAADNTAVRPQERGILAVTLIRARQLSGWQGEADPFVILSLVESAGAVQHGGRAPVAAHEPSQTMRSSTIYNEDSPRWNEKFDFIDVRADSILLATVWDQVTVIEAATSFKLSRERFKDHVLGRVKVPVLDVANAGRLRHRWPLQGAVMGELEMVLQWIPGRELGW